MPNVGALLKQEIVRLARKELRAQVQPSQKASVQYRRDIAALKRQVIALERQVSLLQRRQIDPPLTAPSGSTTQKVRFVAKGLKSQRDRLGVSATDYGRLVGVSAQSVYNWEQGHTSPRPEQVQKIAALRGIGKREAQRHLEQLRAAKSTKRPRKH